MGKYLQGKYKVKNPHKYVGDLASVVYRSSWELKFLNWCDVNPSILKFSSEETIVPYISPIDNKAHRYFIDFKIVLKNTQGQIKTYLVEIKPDSQTRPPVTTRKTKRYIQEVKTWGVNESKWHAATRYAEDRGWQFLVITEYELGLKQRKPK